MAINISSPKRDGIFKKLGGIIGVRILTLLAIASFITGIVSGHTALNVHIGSNSYNLLTGISASFWVWFICLVASTRHTVRYFDAKGLDERELGIRNKIFAHSFGLLILSCILIPVIASVINTPKGVGSASLYSQNYVSDLNGMYLWTLILMPFIVMSTGKEYLKLRESRAKK